MKKTLKQRIENLEEEMGYLKYKLNCLETMSTIARESCQHNQHDWVEEFQGETSTTGTMPRKMRCRKCLLVQYVY